MRTAAGVNVLRLLPLLIPLAAASIPAGQDRTRFAGTWTVADTAVADATIAREMIVKEAAAERLALIVERRFENGARSDTYEIDLIGGTVGGVVEGTPGEAMTRTTYSVRLVGDTLHIASGSYTGPTHYETREFSEREEVWTLQEDGTLAVTVTSRRSGSEPVRAQATYKRK